MRRRLMLAAGLCAAAAAAVWLVAVHVGRVQTLDLQVIERLEWLGGYRGWQMTHGVLSFFDPAPYAVLAVAVIGGALAARRPRAALAAAVLLAGSALTT